MQHPIHIFLIAVALAAVINFFLAGLLGDIAFNIGRVIIAFAGGWIIVGRLRCGFFAAAAVGVLVLCVDHLILKGGYFMLAHFAFPSAVDGSGLMAAAGVLVSFLMFAPIAALVSLIGGILSRSKGLNAHASP